MATVTTVKEARYILTNVAGNNNKFWNIKLFSDNACETHWGRVGEDGQRKSFCGAGEAYFNSKCREKENKGYKPSKTLANTAGTANALGGERLVKMASEQIHTDCPETASLIAFLARVNRHRILEATTLQYDESHGTFSTPLGIVTADALTEARTLLSTLGNYVYAGDWDNSKFVPALNDYLMLIPQNIGRAKPDPKLLFPDLKAVQAQNSILDALEASLTTVLNAAEGEKKDAAPLPKLFEAKLTQVIDPREIDRIRRKYRATQKAMHACAHLDVKRVFAVDIASMNQAFEAKGKAIGNIWELWHGTQASNLLSILKSGFVIPPASSPHCTGRMFGNGVYFSDQSTKSLNYAYGYWNGSKSDQCFMFLSDVAMGKTYTPKSHAEKLPRPDADSTFAKANRSGVMNNEMIVYNTYQIRPTFLVEFGSGK